MRGDSDRNMGIKEYGGYLQILGATNNSVSQFAYGKNPNILNVNQKEHFVSSVLELQRAIDVIKRAYFSRCPDGPRARVYSTFL